MHVLGDFVWQFLSVQYTWLSWDMCLKMQFPSFATHTWESYPVGPGVALNKFIDTESRTEVTRRWGTGEGFFLMSVEFLTKMFQAWIVVMVSQHCEYA